MIGISSNSKTTDFESVNLGATPSIPSKLDEIYFEEYVDSCDEFNVESPDSLVGKTAVL